MSNNPEIPQPEFAKKDHPDLKTLYSAERKEEIPFVTLWEGEFDELHFDFIVNKTPFKTAEDIEKVRDSLIAFQTKGKNYSDNPKSRLDSFVIGNRFLMTFSKVNYSDYIVTNNSMEIVLPSGKTVRDVLEPGPELKPLSESKCSNHLGISCLMITADNKLILNVGTQSKITGAGKISSSASGSMDYKEPHVTPFEVMHAELYEELGIVPSEKTSDIRAIALARDLQRGGKPEMFFVMYTAYKADDILSMVGSDPDKEVERVYAVDLPENLGERRDKIIELSQDPNNAQSTQAALYYFARNLNGKIK